MNFIIELSKLLKLDINESKILKTFRIKARNVPPGKTRPLNVEFHNTKDKFAFLNALTKNDRHSFLDSTEFKDVKCFPDRTYLQRENLKAFKLEMETRNKQMETQAVFGDSFDLEERFDRMRLMNMKDTEVIAMGFDPKDRLDLIELMFKGVEGISD